MAASFAAWFSRRGRLGCSQRGGAAGVTRRAETMRRRSCASSPLRPLSKEPQQTPLPEGADGGGGVRIFPPNLHESLGSYAECFQTMPRTAVYGRGGAWCRELVDAKDGQLG